MKFCVFIFLTCFACKSISSIPCQSNEIGGLRGLLGGFGKITGSLSKITGGVNRAVGGLSLLTVTKGKGNHGSNGKLECNGTNNQREIDNQRNEESTDEITPVASEIDGVFDLIMETINTVANTGEVMKSTLAVADVVYVTLAVISNVNDEILNDNNAFCELSAYLEAAVERLLVNVNGVVTSVTCIVPDISDECDIITLKWVIEAVVSVAGTMTNAASAVLEHTVDVFSGKVENVDTSKSLSGLTSALSGISTTLSQVTTSSTKDMSGIISSVDLQNTLGGVTDTVSSIIKGLRLTNITDVVNGLVGSISGVSSGLFDGITGTLSRTLNGVVSGVGGGVLRSVSGLGGSTAVVSQLTNQVSGIVTTLSDVTLNTTQVITVVVSIIGNISAVSTGLNGILGKLRNIGNIGGDSFKILPCGC